MSTSEFQILMASLSELREQVHGVARDVAKLQVFDPVELELRVRRLEQFRARSIGYLMGGAAVGGVAAELVRRLFL